MVAAGGVPTVSLSRGRGASAGASRPLRGLARPPDEAPEPAGARGDEAAALIADALAGGAGWLGSSL